MLAIIAPMVRCKLIAEWKIEAIFFHETCELRSARAAHCCALDAFNAGTQPAQGPGWAATACSVPLIARGRCPRQHGFSGRRATSMIGVPMNAVEPPSH